MKKLLLMSMMLIGSIVNTVFMPRFDSYRYFYTNRYPVLGKFFDRYRCSDKVDQTIQLSPKEYIQNDVVKVAGYYCKTNFERIINAKRLENYFKLNPKKYVGVTKKYLNKDLCVVASGISGDGEDWEMTPDEQNEMVEDFKSVVQDTKYTDLHGLNFKTDLKSKKLMIIDTETRSFQFLETDIHELEIQKYDDADINFGQVVQEFRQYKKDRAFYSYLACLSPLF